MMEPELQTMSPPVSAEEFKVGDRCELSSVGRLRCFRYSSMTGTIVSAPKHHSWVRVQFDGSKNPRTLHKSYVARLQPALVLET